MFPLINGTKRRKPEGGFSRRLPLHDTIPGMTSPATTTLFPRSASLFTTSTIPTSKNWASSIPITSLRASVWSRTSAEVSTASARRRRPPCETTSTSENRVSIFGL